jgi:Icc-related predicted phosphoesterase
MKIDLTSDVHLEFGDYNIANTNNADVLILSGDICVAEDIRAESRLTGGWDAVPNAGFDRVKRGKIYTEFFRRASDCYPDIVYVMGNHEHYHGDYSQSHVIIADMLDRLNLRNIHFLNQSSVELHGYTFLGSTFWTDFNRRDPLTLRSAEYMMRDFQAVKHSVKGKSTGNWKFLPMDAVNEHDSTVKWLQATLDQRRAQNINNNHVVVVGHHAPSTLSIHDKYKHDYQMNGCYATDLSNIMLDYPEIQLWTHGHMHDDFDYTIGSTRVVCNPRGYIGHEARATGHTPKLIELEA